MKLRGMHFYENNLLCEDDGRFLGGFSPNRPFAGSCNFLLIFLYLYDHGVNSDLLDVRTLKSKDLLDPSVCTVQVGLMRRACRHLILP